MNTRGGNYKTFTVLPRKIKRGILIKKYALPHLKGFNNRALSEKNNL